MQDIIAALAADRDRHLKAVADAITVQREGGTPINPFALKDYSDALNDAFADIAAAFRAAAIRAADAHAEEQMIARMAQARRDYIAYRR
ncbi:hypothetical protein Xaut_3685 [Xanthobacter versatilis]|uniref:Uncharacterized protein n=1 Tax=Xanthobacter autotrophicus (strain ATCC BAA-1158 / Py2) TaxID=78245 RepID=A7ILL9_XANP2|nr:hypothetical protein Xaut_3685 [Xanthobacter autotrophicus Py2]